MQSSDAFLWNLLVTAFCWCCTSLPCWKHDKSINQLPRLSHTMLNAELWRQTCHYHPGNPLHCLFHAALSASLTLSLTHTTLSFLCYLDGTKHYLNANRFIKKMQHLSNTHLECCLHRNRMTNCNNQKNKQKLLTLQPKNHAFETSEHTCIQTSRKSRLCTKILKVNRSVNSQACWSKIWTLLKKLWKSVFSTSSTLFNQKSQHTWQAPLKGKTIRFEHPHLSESLSSSLPYTHSTVAGRLYC